MPTLADQEDWGDQGFARRLASWLARQEECGGWDEEDDGKVLVEVAEVSAAGSAGRSGRVRPGDLVVATSASVGDAMWEKSTLDGVVDRARPRGSARARGAAGREVRAGARGVDPERDSGRHGEVRRATVSEAGGSSSAVTPARKWSLRFSPKRNSTRSQRAARGASHRDRERRSVP